MCKVKSWLSLSVVLVATSLVHSQRINDDLVVLYDFLEGEGNVVNDRAPDFGVSGEPVNLTFFPEELSSDPVAGQAGDRPGLISWGESWLNINIDHPADDGTAHGTPDAAAIWAAPAGGDPADGVGYASKIVDKIQETGQFTIEAWVRPETIDNRSNSGRIIWMTVEGTDDASNFVLAQNSCCDGPSAPGGVEVRLNTDPFEPRATLNSGPDHFEDRDLVHFVHTHDTASEETQLYINIEGQAFEAEPAIDEIVLGTDLTGWDPDYVLTVGNDAFRFSRWFGGELHLVAIHDRAFTVDEVQQHFDAGPTTGVVGPPRLEAGDADQDLDFDQLDIVKVSIAAKYLTGAAATWGEGDWDGAPGGKQGDPPAGNGFFDQLDIVTSLSAGKYLTGPYAAVATGGAAGDAQTSLVYHADTGELAVDAPGGNELTSVNITSAGSLFKGDKPAVLDGAFDNFAADNLFKATFGGSFGSISFGPVLDAGIPQETLAADLTVVGSLAGGGDLGPVDLVYVPEPSCMLLGLLACCSLAIVRGRHRVLRCAKIMAQHVS